MAPLEKEEFTRGLSAAHETEFKQQAQIGIEDGVRGSIPVTISASSDADLGQRYLAITILEGNLPNQHFIQTYVPIVIEK